MAILKYITHVIHMFFLCVHILYTTFQKGIFSVLFVEFFGHFLLFQWRFTDSRVREAQLKRFRNVFRSENHLRHLNMWKMTQDVNEMTDFRMKFRKKGLFSLIFFKIHNSRTHIFLYVYTTYTQLVHMSFSGSKYITHVIHMLKVVYTCVMYKIPLC